MAPRKVNQELIHFEYHGQSPNKGSSRTSGGLALSVRAHSVSRDWSRDIFDQFVAGSIRE